ncbi:hypothetical protein SDC9_01945 [bioreactor metagenome]|jgi:hypothetical protein|uniref:N-acetyltransferase domain-containing protein n=1 Tax=bioreactor metagenome TaxID=1076179 RepID=A0A644SP55_9ZZZZ
MSVSIKEVKTREDLKTFIYLPEKIHKNHKNWLHPLYMDDEKFFDKDKNSLFKHNKAVLFLAHENGKAVGRIMGVIPTDYNKFHGKNDARFSFFECFENKEVFNALINAVETWAESKNCTEIIGPMAFSDKEPQGFLTKGFEEKAMLVTNHSFPFMIDFIKGNQYENFVDLVQYDVPITAQILNRYKNFNERVSKNLKIKTVEFTSTKAVKPYVKPVFDLINKTYTEIYGFTKLTEDEMTEFAERFLPLLNPKLIKMITDENGELLAFIIAMADLSEAIKNSRGRILPFGWARILWAMKTSKRLQLLLGAIHPKYQNKGLDAVLATMLFGSALKLGFKTVDSHLIMKDNLKMRGEIEKLEGFNLYKEYCIFRKNLVVG